MHPTIRGWITGWRNMDEFHRVVGRDMIQFRSEDVLDLPPLTETTISVDLSPAEQRVHQELKEESVYVADNGDVVLPQNPLVAVLRMLQACSGWVQYDGKPAERIQPVPSKRKVLSPLPHRFVRAVWSNWLPLPVSPLHWGPDRSVTRLISGPRRTRSRMWSSRIDPPCQPASSLLMIIKWLWSRPAGHHWPPYTIMCRSLVLSNQFW